MMFRLRTFLSLAVTLPCLLLSSGILWAQGQTFTDVLATDPYSPAVEMLYLHGISAGCSAVPARFCPTQPITRGEMAVLLVRTVYAAVNNNPANFTVNSQVPYFNDVPVGHPYFLFIQKLKELNITAGCGDGTNFCSADPITNAQLAVMATRARAVVEQLANAPAPAGLPNCRSGACTSAMQYFIDVAPGHPYFSWIEKAFEIVGPALAPYVSNAAPGSCTAGCFCPDTPATRGQAAIALVHGVFFQ